MDEEELMEKIRIDRIQKQRAEILKVQQDAFQKQEKFWMQYQEVGNSSYCKKFDGSYPLKTSESKLCLSARGDSC